MPRLAAAASALLAAEECALLARTPAFFAERRVSRDIAAADIFLRFQFRHFLYFRLALCEAFRRRRRQGAVSRSFLRVSLASPDVSPPAEAALPPGQANISRWPPVSLRLPLRLSLALHFFAGCR